MNKTNDFAVFDQIAIDRLIKELGVNAKDADYVAGRDKTALKIFVFFVFIFSIFCLIDTQKSPSFRPGMNANRLSRRSHGKFPAEIYHVYSEGGIIEKPRASARGDSFILFIASLGLGLTLSFFIYDYIKLKLVLKHLYRRDIWLLKTLLAYKDIKRFYDSVSASHSQELFVEQNLGNWSRRLDLATFSRHVIISEFIKTFRIHNKIIADLGFGSKACLETLAFYKNTVYGIELNMNVLMASACINQRLCQADVENIPFKSQAFEGVFLLEVLEHLPLPKSALREAQRILKPGGFLLLTTPNRNAIPLNYFLNPLKLTIQFLGQWVERLLAPRPLIGIFRSNYYFHTAYSINEIKYLLEQANFKIKIWVSYGIGGGLISAFLIFSPTLRRILSKLNDMESRNYTGEEYLRLREQLAQWERKYGSKIAKFNIFLQKIPIVNLIGTNHLILAEKS